jgi:hypothetical protein
MPVVSGRRTSFFPRPLDGGKWSASCPFQYIRWEKATGTHWIVAKGRTERCGGERNLSHVYNRSPIPLPSISKPNYYTD